MDFKRIIPLVAVILLAFSIANAYTIINDTVSYDGDYGTISVYPHTCKDFICTQYANLTSKLSGTQNLDFAFQFADQIKNGRIWAWVNISHPFYYCNQYLNVTILENGTYVNSTYCNHTDINQNYYFDWLDISNSFNYNMYNNSHWYWINNVLMQQNITRKVKWQYDTPVIKQIDNTYGSNGKWDLWIKRSSDTISQAFSNGYYVHLDPWWNSSWLARAPLYVNSTTSETDFQVGINVTYTTGMNANFSDLRFTMGEDVVIPFCIYNKLDSNWAYIYFKTNLTIGNTTHYIYYNNPTPTSTSDCPATFDVWDNFNDNSINTTLWNSSAPAYALFSETGGYMQSVANTDSYGSSLPLNFNIYNATRGIVNVSVLLTVDTAYRHVGVGYLGQIFSRNVNFGLTSGYTALWSIGDNKVSMEHDISGVGYIRNSSSAVQNANTWYTIGVNYNTSFQSTNYDSTYNLNYGDTNLTWGTVGLVGVWHDDAIARWDNLSIRKRSEGVQLTTLSISGLYINSVKDETTGASLNFNVTISNATSSTSFNNITSLAKYYTLIPSGDITLIISNVSGGYEQRYFYLVMNANTSYNNTYYLLNNADGLIRSFNVKDMSEVTIPNALVTIKRFIGDSWVTVATKIADGAGVSAFLLNPSTQYQVTACLNAGAGTCSITSTITPSESSYTIYVNTGITRTMTNIFDTVSFVITPSQVSIGRSNASTFNFTVVCTSNDLALFWAELRDVNGTLLSNVSSSSNSGGTVVGTVNTTNYSRVYGTFYIARTGYSTYTTTKNWFVADFGAGNYSFFTILTSGFTNMTGMSSFGKSIVSIFVILGVMAGCNFYLGVGAFGSSLIGMIALTTLTIFGFFSIPAIIVMWIALIGYLVISRGGS
jgi:hypothetical protein